MTIILNALLIIISIGIFAGRMYEILYITDMQTNFLLHKGIIFNPYILPIFIIIALCCGILILGGLKTKKKFFPSHGSFLLALSALFFIISGVTSKTSGGLQAVFTIFGIVGLLLLSLLSLKGKPYEILIVLFLTIFSIGGCIDSIVLNVSSINNTVFLTSALTNIAITLFLLLLYKNAYAPSKSSRMFLYVGGYICFAVTGMLNAAQLTAQLMSSEFALSLSSRYIAYIFIGLYGLAAALQCRPSGKSEHEKLEFEPEAVDAIKVIDNTVELDINVPEQKNKDFNVEAFTAVENASEFFKNNIKESRVTGTEKIDKQTLKQEKIRKDKKEKRRDRAQSAPDKKASDGFLFKADKSTRRHSDEKESEKSEKTVYKKPKY